MKWKKLRSGQYKLGIEIIFTKEIISLTGAEGEILNLAVRYIHRNPVKAHICMKPNEYRWSSDLFYRKNIRSFIDIDFILNMFSVNRYKAIKIYLDIINKEDKSKEEDFQQFRFE